MITLIQSKQKENQYLFYFYLIIHGREYEHPTVGKVKTTGLPVSFGETPEKIYKPSPLLNQHAAEILKKYCNYTKEEIEVFQHK